MVRYKRSFALVIFLSVTTLLAACIRKSHFSDELWDSTSDGNYRIATLEFSERGNLIHRDHLPQLLEEISAESDPLVLVFVHGWKHNGEQDDPNLESFRGVVRHLAESDITPANQVVIGVYIGWPGKSVTLPLAKETTFWSRKVVAEEVGRGGVTEVLLRLENAQSSRDERAVFVTVGHSFGGAIVLSALNEVLLERVVAASKSKKCNPNGIDECREMCVKARSFGDAIILLNPAIEANQVLPLKSAVAERCFPPDQSKLLHVVSTSEDFATHRLFPMGQWLKMLAWREEDSLPRDYRGEPMTLSEHDLDITTVGNYPGYWTGLLEEKDGRYRYCSYALNNAKQCADRPPPEGGFPARSFEPLSFVYTDGGFMSDHNDVFNEKVSAYLATVVQESITRKREGGSGHSGRILCYGQWMGFHSCFLDNLERLVASRGVDP